MKRFFLAVVVLVATSQVASAQKRDAYTESYQSMLGYERAMNQGKMEYQGMLDARANAAQAAMNREIASIVKHEAEYREHVERDARRNKKREVIRNRAMRAKLTGSADRPPGGL